MPGMSRWITLRSLHLTVILPREPTNLKQEASIKVVDTHRCHGTRRLGVGTLDSLQNEGIATQGLRILILFYCCKISCCNFHYDHLSINKTVCKAIM